MAELLRRDGWVTARPIGAIKSRGIGGDLVAAEKWMTFAQRFVTCEHVRCSIFSRALQVPVFWADVGELGEAPTGMFAAKLYVLISLVTLACTLSAALPLCACLIHSFFGVACFDVAGACFSPVRMGPASSGES